MPNRPFNHSKGEETGQQFFSVHFLNLQYLVKFNLVNKNLFFNLAAHSLSLSLH